jgi:hypothetical protein
MLKQYFFGLYCCHIDILLSETIYLDNHSIDMWYRLRSGAKQICHTRTVNIICYGFGDVFGRSSRGTAKRFLSADTSIRYPDIPNIIH